MPPTTALAMVKPADAAIDDSATFCLTSAITRLRAATGSDDGRERQCSGNDVRCRCPWQLRRHGNANDLHVMARDRREAHDLRFLLLRSREKVGAFHERREVASALPSGRMRGRARRRSMQANAFPIAPV